MGTPGYESGFSVALLPNRLDEPLTRRKPTTYFVNSMSDAFHEKVPFGYIDRIFGTIAGTPQHIYQILTKRSARMARYFVARQVPDNVWLGVSVEDRKHGLPRVDDLRSVAARVRFLSIEPLLEPLGNLDLSGIDWVIVGGESGPKHVRCAWNGLRIFAYNAKIMVLRSSSNSGVDGVLTVRSARKSKTAANFTAALGTECRHKRWHDLLHWGGSWPRFTTNGRRARHTPPFSSIASLSTTSCGPI